MTALTPADKERQKTARARAGRIREGIRTYIHTLGDIAAAYAEGDWRTLGYAGWDAYVAAEFGAERLRLSPEHRQKAVEELRLAGLSQRAIGQTLGISKNTVAADLSQTGTPDEVRGIDGKTYSPARSPVVEAMEQAIEDATERAQDHPVPAPGEADTPVSEVDGLKGNGTPSPSVAEAGGSSQGTAPPADSGPPELDSVPGEPSSGGSGSGVTSPTPDPEQERTEKKATALSTDLLRAAAARLREHAKAACPGPWKSGGGDFRPWELVIADDLPFVEFTNDHQGASNAEYAALMHPPVALAVAELLTILSWFPSQEDPTDLMVAELLACEILREPYQGGEAGRPLPTRRPARSTN